MLSDTTGENGKDRDTALYSDELVVFSILYLPHMKSSSVVYILSFLRFHPTSSKSQPEICAQHTFLITSALKYSTFACPLYNYNRPQLSQIISYLDRRFPSPFRKSQLHLPPNLPPPSPHLSVVLLIKGNPPLTCLPQYEKNSSMSKSLVLFCTG